MNDDSTQERAADQEPRNQPSSADGGVKKAPIVSEDAPMDGISSRVIGNRYHIVREIGRGGMGIVYLAQDTRLNRYVAIKRLLVQTSKSKQIQRRFLREARTIASLGHFHIVSIFDIVQDEFDYYIVMEYVPGPEIRENGPPVAPAPPVSLDQYIKIKGPMKPPEATKLIIKLCHAIDYAHHKGTVHRDIKPSNILLDANMEPKLVDFGLARPVEKKPTEEITKAGTLLGTPEYVAPEQWSDDANVDTRVDIFALGAVFWNIMTGELPRYFREAVLPDNISKPLARALSYKRSSRYAVVTEFATDLEATTTGGAKAAPAAERTGLTLAEDQWRCEHCEKGNKESASYCAYCGAKGVANCRMCEAEYLVGTELCPRCGADVEQAESSVTVIQTAQNQAEFLEYESAIETLKDLAGQNHQDAQDLTKAWRVVILQRRNLLMDFDNAVRVRNLEKAVDIAEELRDLVPDECLSESSDFEVVVKFNTNLADFHTLLAESAQQSQLEFNLAKYSTYLDYMNRVYGETACAVVNNELKMTRHTLDHTVTQAGLIVGMNCFSRAMELLNTTDPWRGTELGDRRTRMADTCQALISQREVSIDNIEKALREGQYSDALTQVMDTGRFRPPPNNSEVGPAQDDQEAHERILQIDKVITETIENKIPEWLESDDWDNILNTQTALRSGDSGAWKRLYEILERSVNNVVASRYNTAVELETKANFAVADEAWRKFLAIPKELILHDLLHFANEFPQREKFYNRTRRDRTVKRTAYALFPLWLFPAWIAVMLFINESTLTAQQKIAQLIPDAINIFAVLVMVLIIRSKKLKTYDGKRRFARFSPQLNLAGFLIAASPLVHCVYGLSTLLAKVVPPFENPGIPAFIVLVFCILFDVTRQKSFRLPAGLGLTISWLPVMITLLILNKRMATGDSEFMWPVLALIHAVLYLTLIFVTSILNKDKDEAASGDTVLGGSSAG